MRYKLLLVGGSFRRCCEHVVGPEAGPDIAHLTDTRDMSALATSGEKTLSKDNVGARRKNGASRRKAPKARSARSFTVVSRLRLLRHRNDPTFYKSSPDGQN